MSVVETQALEFKAWPKIPRLRKSLCIVTEKIDGTNAAIHIREGEVVGVQSRKRFIVPGDDNYGFAAWVEANKETLVEDLGDGVHFGEWWGNGIQRGYASPNGPVGRRFSLFNVRRFSLQNDVPFKTPNLLTVPVMVTGPIAEKPWEDALELLRSNGSWAMPGFMKPEGVCVFEASMGALWKVMLENDDKHKGE